MPLSAVPNAEATPARGVASPEGSTWQTTLRLMRFALEVEPRMFLLTILVALGGSISEGFGLVLLLPLLSVAGMSFSGASPASRLGVGAQRLLLLAHIPHWLWLPVVLGVFLATGAVRSGLRRSQSMLAFTTTTKVELALSRRVYESVVRARWGFLVRQRAGRLTHVLTLELRQVAESLTVLLSLINVAALTLLYLALALKLSPAITLLVLAIGGGLLLLQRHSLERMRESGRNMYESLGEVHAATEEHLLNLKSVKTYNAEDRDVRMFAELCGEVARHTGDSARYEAASDFRFEIGSLVALGAVIFLALGVLHVQAATVLLLLAIFTRLMPQLSSLQNQTHLFAQNLPALDDVLAIEAECLTHAETIASSADMGGMRLEREFRLEQVWFSYQADAAQPVFVLRGIDLEIEAGTVTVVVGPSGSGKSTIADLTNGLLQTTRGRLLLDGRELAPQEMRPWRQHVGYVGQETVLFHQSVRENLLWAQPGATEEDLREALLQASAGFVYELPGGIDSTVGDRGILLSSGQRQRISLARALLRKPSLLILDEATNSLDVENEARVLDAIRDAVAKSKRPGEQVLTVLMIAHRASAIRRADRILELEDGRIARSGTWEELV